jgi:hypothetical protein
VLVRKVIPAALVLLVLNGRGRSEAEDAATTAQRALRLLAAVGTVQKRLADEGLYAVPREQILRLLKKDLPSHRDPAFRLIQAGLRRHFTATLDALVRKAAGEQDKDDRFGVLGLLRKRCEAARPGDKESLKGAVQRYEERLAAKSLADDYLAIRLKVAQEHILQARKQLKADAAFPTLEEIERAATGPNQKEEVIAAWKRCHIVGKGLLAEAEDLAYGVAQSLVEDGLKQLEDQVKVVEEKPTAHTRGGMAAEFAARQQAYVKSRKPKPDRKVYPVFPTARKAAVERAASLWDQSVADATAGITRQLTRREREIAADYRAKIRKAILADPREHHTFDRSVAALRPISREAQAEARAWVSKLLKEAALEEKSKYDKDHLKSVAETTEEALDRPASSARIEGARLADAVREAVLEMIKGVRQGLAREQAKKHGERLADGGYWKPNERQLLAYDRKKTLTREVLAGWKMWKGQPPIRTAVLEETWQLWFDQARARLDPGLEAIRGQEKIVDALAEEMTGRIRKEPALGTAHWARTYANEVANRWRREGSAASARYPALFGGTRTRIDGLVAQVLQNASKDAQRALVEEHFTTVERAIIREIFSAGNPAVNPHLADFRKLVLGDWRKHELAADHPDLFSEMDELMRGKVQKCIDAQVPEYQKRMKVAWAIPEDENKNLGKGFPDPKALRTRLTKRIKDALGEDWPLPDDLAKRISGVAEKAKVLFEQNRVVDASGEIIGKSIEREANTGDGDLRMGTWKPRFVERVEKAWAMHELAGKHPALLPEVRERIDGIAARLLTDAELPLKARIRHIQEKLIKDHEPIEAEQIRTEKAQGKAPDRPACCDRYTSAVLKAWTTRVDLANLRRHSRTLFHGGKDDLLRESKEQIRGIVDRLIPESAPAPPSPARDPEKPELRMGPNEFPATSPEGEKSSAGPEPGGPGNGGPGRGDGPGGGGLGLGDLPLQAPEVLQKGSNWLLFALLAAVALGLYLYFRKRRGGTGTGDGLEQLLAELYPLFRRLVVLHREEARRILQVLILKREMREHHGLFPQEDSGPTAAQSSNRTTEL